MIALALAAALVSAPATELEAASPTGPLKGTFLKAEAAEAPVAVVIPGSGPTDRDGNSPLGIRAASYRLLAEGLQAQGVSSVRVDKRAQFGSAGAPMPAEGPSMELYAADARLWARTAARAAGRPCAWLVGHSEGALVALMAAAEGGDEVCGVVMVAGAGRRLSDVIREQLVANPANGPFLEPAMAALSELEAGRRVDPATLPPVLLSLFNPAAQTLLISSFKVDPAALLARYPGPTLVVHGTTDIQVSGEDARRLREARPGVRYLELAGVNHMLKTAPADRGANFATYAAPDLPLAAGVAEGIAAFLKSPPARP